jgi:hypothetical protein
MHVSQFPHGTKLLVLSRHLEPHLQAGQIVTLDHGLKRSPPHYGSVFYVRRELQDGSSTLEAVPYEGGDWLAPTEQWVVEPSGWRGVEARPVLPDPAGHAAAYAKQKAFGEACKPLIRYLREHHHQHVTAVVSADSAELLEGMLGVLSVSD